MGLDQYARVQKCNLPEHAEEFCYWRKHADLQGWMEKLWNEKGRPILNENGLTESAPEGEDFNCIALYLQPADLDRLEKDVKRKKLPKTTGFFFGESTSDDRETDLKFIREAREHLKNGYSVFYFSWY